VGWPSWFFVQRYLVELVWRLEETLLAKQSLLVYAQPLAIPKPVILALILVDIFIGLVISKALVIIGKCTEMVVRARNSRLWLSQEIQHGPSNHSLGIVGYRRWAKRNQA
jgi:hypothetical protein